VVRLVITGGSLTQDRKASSLYLDKLFFFLRCQNDFADVLDTPSGRITIYTKV